MPYTKETYEYKTVLDCSLQADVYKLDTEGTKPAIIWLHGGGLIFGSRSMIPKEQLELYLEAGYIVISVDYRLAPETKIKEIVEDVKDAYNWVCSKGPKLFDVDPNRLAVIGHSSGGYLAFMLGFNVNPKPRAIVSFYGYGDITKEWIQKPNEHYLKESIVSKEVAYQGVSDSVISGSQFTGYSDKRFLFYIFCTQQGRWISEVGANEDIEKFCPVNFITHNYPPTLFLHGDQDIDVPVEQSKQMAALLKANHVQHKLIIMENQGHIFDIVPDPLTDGAPSGLKHPKVLDAFNAVISFVNKLNL